MTTFMPPMACPGCGHRLDASTAVVSAALLGQPPPAEGDLTLCIHCADVLMFDAELRPRAVAPAALDEIMATHAGLQDIVDQVRVSIAQVHRRH